MSESGASLHEQMQQHTARAGSVCGGARPFQVLPALDGCVTNILPGKNPMEWQFAAFPNILDVQWGLFGKPGMVAQSFKGCFTSMDTLAQWNLKGLENVNPGEYYAALGLTHASIEPVAPGATPSVTASHRHEAGVEVG